MLCVKVGATSPKIFQKNNASMQKNNPVLYSGIFKRKFVYAKIYQSHIKALVWNKSRIKLERNQTHTQFLRQSSSTSKLEVSVGLLTSGMQGASHVRMLSQSISVKKGCCLKSSIPCWPNRCSLLQISRRMRSLASSDTSVT